MRKVRDKKHFLTVREMYQPSGQVDHDLIMHRAQRQKGRMGKEKDLPTLHPSPSGKA